MDWRCGRYRDVDARPNDHEAQVEPFQIRDKGEMRAKRHWTMTAAPVHCRSDRGGAGISPNYVTNPTKGTLQ